MSGYYVPSSFSSSYVANKKNENGTYHYDSQVNQAGIETQRSLQQLNKQYNNTINQAYGQNLLANKGLRASMLGSGYKEAYMQNMQQSLLQDMSQADLSVQQTKQSIFQALGNQLGNIANTQLQDVNNMRRMAGSLERYHEYLQTLSMGVDNKYVDDQGFKVGPEWTFEDNYDKLFGTQKGIIGQYRDEYNNPALALEDWLRQNSGNTDKDTAWLDWAYSTGFNQYKDFIKNGVKKI
jgi:hypothetical protein